MNQTNRNDRIQSRRQMMLGTLSLGAAAALGVMAGSRVLADEAEKHSLIPSDRKINGFAIGCQAWSFNRYTVLEAIEKTATAGGKVIEFFPGQRLEKDQPAVTFGHTSPDGVIEKVQAKLKEQNIQAVNYGVVTVKGKDQWRQVFSFAKKLGLIGVTSEPHPDDMDEIEQLVKEFDIRLGIHDHPKRPKDESYKFWDPNYVLSLVKDRDKRMGSCADTGHWVRSGIKPVDALKVLEGRVMSSHLKDLNQFDPKGYDVPWGTGISDVKGILAELKRQGFEGNISIEWEHHPDPKDDNLKEITECIDFAKNLS